MSFRFTRSPPVQRSLLLGIALVSIAAGLLAAPALGFFGKAKSFATEVSANSVAIGDLNGDGKPDLAVAGGDGVSVLLGHGDGGFGKPKTFAASTTSIDEAGLSRCFLEGDHRWIGRLAPEGMTRRAIRIETPASAVRDPVFAALVTSVGSRLVHRANASKVALRPDAQRKTSADYEATTSRISAEIPLLHRSVLPTPGNSPSQCFDGLSLPIR